MSKYNKVALQRNNNIPPSAKRILAMKNSVLIEHNSLVLLKKSKLSASQRQRVLNRVKHLISKGKITNQEVHDSLETLKQTYGRATS